MNLRNFGIAFSLANLLFYPVWAELLPGAYGHYYLMNPPTFIMNLAMISVVSLCALALYFGNKLNLGFKKTIFLILLFIALNGIRSHLLRFSHWQQYNLFSQVDRFFLRPGLLVCTVLLLTKWRDGITRAAAVWALALVPFAIMTFSQAAWACVKIQSGIPFAEFAEPGSAPLLTPKPGTPRFIWLLFDALDEHLVFQERPSDVELPQLDAFRNQAVYAASAYAPGGSTLESIPSLFIGKPVIAARPTRADALFIQFDNTGETGQWSKQPSLFLKARELGCNSALVGYYHPYCRILGNQLASCFWRTGRWDALGLDDPRVTLPKAMSRILRVEARRLAASIPFIWRLGLSPRPDGAMVPQESSSIEERVEKYSEVLQEAKRVIGDPSFQLIFIHWPVPHHPYIYDRHKDDFNRESETTYLDNLELVDRTLGEVRTLLEQKGMWDPAAVLVTSDHPKISRNYEQEPVPFLLKLPGQKQMLRYERRFNTVILPDLAIAVLSGKLSDPDRAAAWLDQYAANQ